MSLGRSSVNLFLAIWHSLTEGRGPVKHYGKEIELMTTCSNAVAIAVTVATSYITFTHPLLNPYLALT